MLVQLAAMLLLGHLVQSPTGATGAEPAAPILVLLHHSVWFSSVDRPWFILYDDGAVIYPKDRERQIPLSYQRTRIAGKSTADLLDQFGVQNEYWRLDSVYDFAPMITDQETVFLLAWDESRFRRVAVRAALEENGSLNSKTPSAFRRVFDQIRGFHADSSSVWQPDTVEVAAWPYEYAPDNPPLQWRSDWPNLKTRGTRRIDDPYVKELYLMRFSYSLVPALDSLLGRRREKQAIAINGRKWAVGYRFLFPAEQRWRMYVHHLEQ